MDTPNSSPVISPATYLIIGIALFLAGSITGVFADPYLPPSLSNTEKGYQAGFTAARTLVEKSSLGVFFAAAPSDMRTVSGTVTRVASGSVTLHNQAASNPFDETPALSDRTVLIGANTKIIRLVPKDAKTIQAETAALLKAHKTQQVAPYTQTVVSISSIKVGDSLVVTAGDNIKTASTFTAVEIRIQPHLP